MIPHRVSDMLPLSRTLKNETYLGVLLCPGKVKAVEDILVGKKGGGVKLRESWGLTNPRLEISEFKYYVGIEVWKVYLSAMLDLYDRRIISFVISDRNDNPLVNDSARISWSVSDSSIKKYPSWLFVSQGKPRTYCYSLSTWRVAHQKGVWNIFCK